MMRLHYLLAGLALIALQSVAVAADVDRGAQRLAASCANCHGTNGAAAGNAIPALAGMPKPQLIAAMQAFKNGTRKATVMHQLARGYTDEQIELMAGFFAAQHASK